MHSDLVRAPGKQVRPEKIHGIEARKPGKIRPCGPSGIDDRHPLSVSRIPGDRPVDGEPIVAKVPPAQNRIPANDLPGLERGAKDSVGTVGFGDEQQSRCFFVQPVDDPFSAFLGARRERAAPTLEGIYEGARPIPGSRVNNHSRGLVDDENVCVLEYDGERNIFADHLAAHRWRYVDRDTLTLARSITRSFASPVDENVPPGDQRRRLVTRQIELCGDGNVESGKVRSCDELVMGHPEESSHAVTLIGVRLQFA
jgi:hypothetical protein